MQVGDPQSEIGRSYGETQFLRSYEWSNLRGKVRRGENYERGALLIIFSVGLCKTRAEQDRMRPCDYCKSCYVL